MKKLTSLLFAIGLTATALTGCNKGGKHQPQPTPIDLVNVSVGEPTLGQTPLEVRSSFVVYSHVCDVTTIEWSYKNNSGQWTVLDNDVAFTYDTEYKFEMTITANDKFAFNDNTEFKVDGVNVTEGVDVQSTTLIYTKQFAAVSATISSVAITGVTAPVVGEHPTLSGINLNDERIRLDTSVNTKWVRGEEYIPTFEEDTFQTGVDYRIFITIYANAGFVFDTNLISSVSTSAATVNGNNAEKVVLLLGDYTKIRVIYNFGSLSA